jgi:hypothetical protein
VAYATSTIRLGWEPALSPDVTAYIIYHLENGLWVPADTVYGTTTWVDAVNTATTTQEYRVAALDSCLNSSAMSDPQHNIRVTAKLRGWTDYKNGDTVCLGFKRKHFFDKETTNAIRKGDR